MNSWAYWDDKAREIQDNLAIDKCRVVDEQLEFFSTPKGIKAKTLGRSFFSAVPEDVNELIDKYVINGVAHEIYPDGQVVDHSDIGYITITHDLLLKYVGKYFTETVAAKEFLDPNLEIESAVLVRYLSNETRYKPPVGSEYVIEHVYGGEMHVLYENTPDYMRLGMYRPLLAHGYQPGVDDPMDILIHKNLDVLVFTYKNKEVIVSDN